MPNTLPLQARELFRAMKREGASMRTNNHDGKGRVEIQINKKKPINRNYSGTCILDFLNRFHLCGSYTSKEGLMEKYNKSEHDFSALEAGWEGWPFDTNNRYYAVGHKVRLMCGFSDKIGV